MSNLYEKAREHVLKSITSGKYDVGVVLPPAEKLATKLSCSTGTIRNVLTDLASEGILRRVQRKGTVVARRPSTGRVVLMLAHDAHTNLIFQDVLLEVLVNAGYWVDLLPLSLSIDPVKAHLNKILADGAQSDALVMLDPRREAVGLFQEFMPRFARHVVIQSDNRNPIPGTFLITHNHLRSSKDVVEHLLKLGHRKIGVVAGLGPNETSFAFETATYCRDFMEVAGGESVFHFFGGTGPDDVVDFLVENQITAYWSITDHHALTVLNAAMARGLRVPDHFSLVGRNDTPWALDCVPQLTSVSMNARGIATALVEVLAQLKPGQPPNAMEAVRKVDPQLIVRHSTGPAPSALSPRKNGRRLAGG